jgi:trimeric autotransporter adhesin
MNFNDVHPSDYFYQAIYSLSCRGIVSGYADGTFRPYNNTTRGQLTKIIVLAVGWIVECPSLPHFTDVLPGSPFYCYVETAYAHGIISGYTDGTFRPGNNVTRGQLCKIISLAMPWTLICPLQPHFLDVLPDHPFYCYIETAYQHNVIAGYADGTFRPGSNATRGQICVIIYRAIGPPPCGPLGVSRK